jgi:hypothetical protein
VLVAHPVLVGVAGSPNDAGQIPGIKHTRFYVFEWLLELKFIPN